MTIIDRRYSVAEGTAIKAPCRAATTANITLAGEQTIDGVALTETSPPTRVLVKDQSTASENGIYDVSTGNWTRSRDFDGAYDIVEGTRVFVTDGTVNGYEEFIVATSGTIVVGTTSITFSVGIVSQSAIAAAASASAAATSATNAATAETNAETAETNAETALSTTQAVLAAAYGAVMLNGSIVESRAAGATTFAVKTIAGADPTALSPVYFVFRTATGTYAARTVSAALSITIPSGATMGFTSATAGRIWLLALDNAGTVELVVVNCRNGINLYALQGWGTFTTTILNTSSDSAAVPYSATARAGVNYITVGSLTWESGLTTAGTWDAAPSRIQLFGPGVKLPGDRVQVQRNVVSSAVQASTVIPNDDTIPQNTEGGEVMTQAITPTSAANLLEVSSEILSYNSGTVFTVAALFQDSVASALAAATQYTALTEQNIVGLRHVSLAGSTSIVTFKIRIGPSSAANLTLNGIADNTRGMGGVSASNLWVEEIVA